MNLPFPGDQAYIGGRWQAAQSGATLTLDNPSTGESLATVARCGSDDVELAVMAATSARAGAWGKLDATDRGRILLRMSQLVAERVDWLAELEALDVGKPLAQGRADALALARYLEFYGGAADKFHGETIPYRSGYTVYTLREPHGITGHIIPWNYPMQIIGRSIGAALTVGNACILKPAEEACLTALAFAYIAEEAGLPAGALNVIPGYGEEVGAALTVHSAINHVSFTGSVGVGALVQSSAAHNAVPVTLELGGKSPQLVFEDADLERALPFLVNAGIQNAGQTCSASSRLLVHRTIYHELVDQLAARYRELTVGMAISDPAVGPLISGAQKSRVSSFLDQAEADGIQVAARAVLGDDLPAGGHYVSPTLFADVPPANRLATDEIFGPVQVVIPFDTEEEAVDLANATDYGLVAGVWTRDGGRQMRLAKAIRSGQVFINNYGAGGGVELPFGGVGKSGHGREKGFEGLYGFTVLKTVATYHG